jgi:uncharacterized membrane protein YphA (DoxX/SURF4 family)
VTGTASFILFTLIATLIVFVLILWNHSIGAAEKMARAFYILCLFLGVTALIHVILSISGATPVNRAYSLFRRVHFNAGWFIIGTGVSSVVLSVLNVLWPFRPQVTSEAVRSFIYSQRLLKGLCLSVSLSFFSIEIGKSGHDMEMRQFFLESGYTVWFMYLIMALEILGAIGLFISRAIVPSALGLMILMSGAIYTHYRNNDPFSDSLDAFRLLILLTCVIILKLFPGKVPNSQAKQFGATLRDGQGSAKR